MRGGAQAAAYTPISAAKRAMISVARRWQALDLEVQELDTHLKAILDESQPALKTSASATRPRAAPRHCRRQPRAAAQRTLLRRALGRLAARASSGRTERHRLNRGGDRQANTALWRIVFTAGRPPARSCLPAVSPKEDKAEVMRCLKRYIAREVFPLVRAINDPESRQDLQHKAA